MTKDIINLDKILTLIKVECNGKLDAQDNAIKRIHQYLDQQDVNNIDVQKQLNQQQSELKKFSERIEEIRGKNVSDFHKISNNV